jgi:hypothetical protein
MGGAVTEGEVEAAWLGTQRRCSARQQPAGWAVAMRQQTGGGRRRRGGPSGLQRPGGLDDRVGRFQKWKTKMKKWSWVGLRGTFGPKSDRAAKKNRKLFSESLFQGNGIQIKSFEYFQTKFVLYSK